MVVSGGSSRYSAVDHRLERGQRHAYDVRRTATRQAVSLVTPQPQAHTRRLCTHAGSLASISVGRVASTRAATTTATQYGLAVSATIRWLNGFRWAKRSRLLRPSLLLRSPLSRPWYPGPLSRPGSRGPLSRLRRRRGPLSRPGRRCRRCRRQTPPQAARLLRREGHPRHRHRSRHRRQIRRLFLRFLRSTTSGCLPARLLASSAESSSAYVASPPRLSTTASSTSRWPQASTWPSKAGAQTQIPPMMLTTRCSMKERLQWKLNAFRRRVPSSPRQPCLLPPSPLLPYRGFPLPRSSWCRAAWRAEPPSRQSNAR
mmetsp:Transcript_58445/g.134104  ORF Transcript_58445/g.134104 Transcript_58445/m.134104 type:complete len:315 (+) Transcript_58445:66-1010(+)